jgi:hypothetical protein
LEGIYDQEIIKKVESENDGKINTLIIMDEKYLEKNIQRI